MWNSLKGVSEEKETTAKLSILNDIQARRGRGKGKGEGKLAKQDKKSEAQMDVVEDIELETSDTENKPSTSSHKAEKRKSFSTKRVTNKKQKTAPPTPPQPVGVTYMSVESDVEDEDEINDPDFSI